MPLTCLLESVNMSASWLIRSSAPQKTSKWAEYTTRGRSPGRRRHAPSVTRPPLRGSTRGRTCHLLRQSMGCARWMMDHACKLGVSSGRGTLGRAPEASSSTADTALHALGFI